MIFLSSYTSPVIELSVSPCPVPTSISSSCFPSHSSSLPSPLSSRQISADICLFWYRSLNLIVYRPLWFLVLLLLVALQLVLLCFALHHLILFLYLCLQLIRTPLLGLVVLLHQDLLLLGRHFLVLPLEILWLHVHPLHLCLLLLPPPFLFTCLPVLLFLQLHCSLHAYR